MKSHQEGREAAVHCRICSGVDQFALIIMAFKKIRHISLSLPMRNRNISMGNRNISMGNRIPWKEIVASCLIHSPCRSIGKEIIVLINP